MKPLKQAIKILAASGWLLATAFLCQAQTTQESKTISGQHFAFIDYELIFTLEIVDKVPIFNFANITDRTYDLSPSNLLLSFQNRRFPIKFFRYDTGVEGHMITVPGLKMHPRSSFGFSLKGNFSGLEKLDKVTVKLKNEMFELEPISKNDFEMLAAKINKINLGSPDIRDDYRVLRIPPKGKRTRRE